MQGPIGTARGERSSGLREPLPGEPHTLAGCTANPCFPGRGPGLPGLGIEGFRVIGIKGFVARLASRRTRPVASLKADPH